MTEKSYFWDHGTGSDAAYSPYNAVEFDLVHFMPHIGENTGEGYVIPDYLDSLYVERAEVGKHGVIVNPGAAVLNNYFYELDEAVYLSLRTTSGYIRYDYIVLRYTVEEGQPKVRLAVLEGEDEVTGSIIAAPALTQSPWIWEVPLALVYIESGLSSFIYHKNVIDTRQFVFTEYIKNKYGYQDNLLRNSEFLSFSFEGNAAAPDSWGDVTSVNTYARGTGIGDSGRSYSYGNDSTGFSRGLCQWMHVTGNTFSVFGKTYRTDREDEIIIDLRAYTTTGQESEVYRQVQYINCDASVDFKFTVTFPEEDIAYLKISLLCGTDASIGQAYYADVQVVKGYFPGWGHLVNEPVMCYTEIVDAATWTASARSSSTVTINLVGSFNNQIKVYTRALLLRLKGRDSGSAAGAPSINVQGYVAPYNEIYGTLELQGVPNDKWRETVVIVPINQGLTNASFRINMVATGAATLDVTLEIVGVLT